MRDVLVTVVLDLSALNPDAFWTVLDHKSLVYPFDAQGRRRDFADIPKTIMQLKDDPFRSLAGELRRAGGFAKDTTPFSEFLWADFFRRDGAGAAPGEKRRGGISAGLVRPQGRRVIAAAMFAFGGRVDMPRSPQTFRSCK